MISENDKGISHSYLGDIYEYYENFRFVKRVIWAGLPRISHLVS